MADTRPIYGWCANAACPAGNNSVEVCNDPGCALTGMLHHAVENGCSSCREHPGKKGAGWWRPIGDGMANFLGMSDVPSASMLRVCPTCVAFQKAAEMSNGQRGAKRASRWEFVRVAMLAIQLLSVVVTMPSQHVMTMPSQHVMTMPSATPHDYAAATCYDYAVATCYDYAAATRRDFACRKHVMTLPSEFVPAPCAGWVVAGTRGAASPMAMRDPMGSSSWRAGGEADRLESGSGRWTSFVRSQSAAGL